MPTKRALIVDDSRTAQFKLTKTLEVYDLEIDTVSSAEEALSYLSYQKPDVIFMDHSMKGMNGLEAVRIIKSNVATATIPMVMYTAQSGDVYLSQARAIGAIDVLSKDVMTDSDIKRVMSVLKISALDNDRKDQQETILAPTESPADSDRELHQIRDQVASSLAIQQGQFHRELQDNTRLLLSRFMHEMRNLRQQTERQKVLDRDLILNRLEDQSSGKSSGISTIWGFVLGALCISLISTLWLINNERDINQSLAKTNESLSEQINARNQDLQKSRRLLELNKTQSNSPNVRNLLRTLVWAVNQTGKFDFNELALGSSRSEVISGLVAQLSEINFQGTLTLNIHNGDFCVVTNENGNLSLPDQPIPIWNCDFLSNSSYSFDQASQMSVEFINLLQSYPIVERGDLKIDVQAHGLSRPITRYPDIEQVYTSDQWNNIAQANNYLKVSLSN